MRFFGKLPIIRGDKTELYLIAGAAWRSEATDEELTADDLGRDGFTAACGSQIKIEGRPTRESAVKSVKARLQARDLMGDAENHLDEAKRLQKELE